MHQSKKDLNIESVQFNARLTTEKKTFQNILFN